jgi:hypothetical protein
MTNERLAALGLDFFTAYATCGDVQPRYVGMPLGSYSATRAWSSEVMASTVERLQKQGLIADGALTPAGLRLREEIEEHTDAMEQPLIEAIGSDFETLVTQLNEWSELCIKAGAFPPNIQKRAAG